MDDMLAAYLSEIATITGVLAAVAAPFVLWAIVRYRRAGPLVAGAPIALPGGAYRDGTARPMFARGLPWVVYAALLASLMGAAFVVAAVGYELFTRHTIGAGLPSGLVHKLGTAGCSVARLLLLDAAIAALRRRPSASRRAWIAAGVALVSTAVYANWVLEASARLIEPMLGWIDGALYAGGLMATAALVLLAQRAMARLGRAGEARAA